MVNTIQDLNDIANDIAVSRLEVSELERKRDEILASIPELAELEEKIAEAKLAKDEATEKLLVSMRSNDLKSWKTEQANFARAVRKTATLDPVIKKQIEDKLKRGEVVDGWTLSEKEYISIRLTPVK